MSIRIRALAERIRSSLFFVPLLCIGVGFVVGLAMLELDDRVGEEATQLPLVLTSTVDSARSVLSVIAQATVTVAGIAFSVSLLVIQQAASQYSPRVVHTLFRDPFNRRVVGLVLGTFTYCLMVLRAVRGPGEDGGEAVIPNLSVALSVVLGITAILAIVAFIDHNAHAMEVSQILGRVSRQTVDQVEVVRRSESDAEGRDRPEVPEIPEARGRTVPLPASGWIQQIDRRALARLAPPGGVVRVDTAVGRYAIEGTSLCTVWPDVVDDDDIASCTSAAVQVGQVRTMQEDLGYGIRQLADVALIALSPGVNDPTTAQDAIFHLVGVLRVLLIGDLAAPVVIGPDGQQVVCSEDHTYDSLVDLAFTEIRQAAAEHSVVCTYLLEGLRLLDEAVCAAGHPERTEAIVRHADLVAEAAAASDMLLADRDAVAQAHRSRFGS